MPPPPLPPRSHRRRHAVANALPRRCYRCQRAADATIALPAAAARRLARQLDGTMAQRLKGLRAIQLDGLMARRLGGWTARRLRVSTA
jgi:hypothetical protein